MTIQLSPELEEIIRQDVDRGPYASAEEYLEHGCGFEVGSGAL